MSEATIDTRLPYEWTQTLTEVSVTVPVPSGTTKKDLDITIGKNKLKVALKGQPPIIDGELCQTVKIEDSFWSVVDKTRVHIELQKINTQQWWECVIKGHPAIDTTKIEPENSKLEDLDGETRGMVEKMMFDQRQKAAGKPTSDELKKMEVFENFKKQHPEMDFSNTKFS